jgi:hypothetical protein
MPYKKVVPATDSDMKKKRYTGHYTICQKLREIYELTKDPEIQSRCKEAMTMAKRMHEALKDYKVYRESGENVED